MKTVEEMVSRATDLCSDAASYTYSPTRIRVIRGHLEPLAEALALREKALAVATEALRKHKRMNMVDGCDFCGEPWPCPEYRALSEVSRLLAGEPKERS